MNAPLITPEQQSAHRDQLNREYAESIQIGTPEWNARITAEFHERRIRVAYYRERFHEEMRRVISQQEQVAIMLGDPSPAAHRASVNRRIGDGGLYAAGGEWRGGDSAAGDGSGGWEWVGVRRFNSMD